MSEHEVMHDLKRGVRIGLDEAILCAGKSLSQLAHILDQTQNRGDRLLLTRLVPEQLATLPEVYRKAIDYDELSGTGFFGPVATPDSQPRVALLIVGSSDLGPAREAVRTLRYNGECCIEVYDVGIAGLWRLLDRIDEIRAMPVIIAAAGMDGALPSVVAGLVSGVVIALPTFTGYGAAEQGRTALRAALASCAPGLVVVNIDNGYGAACAALRMLHAIGPSAAAPPG